MSIRQASAKSSIYKNSPSIEEMKQDKKFRKTLRFYQGVIQGGMMVLLDDLEEFPAPALCSFCEAPVITRTKNERSGQQKFNIAWATLVSIGTLTYSVASTNKDVVHECPACGYALATWVSQLNGAYHVIKVHKPYKNPTSSSTQQHGHAAENFQVGGYATVQIGDRYFYTNASSQENS